MNFPMLLLLIAASLITQSNAFAPHRNPETVSRAVKTLAAINGDVQDESRRNALVLAGTFAAGSIFPQTSSAAVGSLPELAEDNAILQGITIRVADKSQQDSMIAFLEEGFFCEVLRKRIRGNIEETWLGFGPEQLSIPDDFQAPVSSFQTYGGHASIHIVYDKTSMSALYRKGENAPGDNIAFVQMGVPEYRISQMVKNGGNILDAYGYVNVVSPSGLPIRGIVGISPDPLMFVAINCANVDQSRAFYEQLGFAEQEYPYARPSKGMGQFEPLQPGKSVYMAPSKNSMGVLLLPTKRGKKVSVNPVVDSLNIVYTPSSEGSDDASVPNLTGPSGESISFQSVGTFSKEESITR